MAWTAPPEPVVWTIKPVAYGGTTYTTITLRAPAAGDIIKATAVPGQSGLATALRLISAISGETIPYEALLSVPAWQIEQMSQYFESFSGSPLPDPLAPNATADVSAGSASPAA
jgi:hypothetical protein